MWLYVAIGVGVLIATVIFHIIIWNVFFKPRLQKQAQLLEQQKASSSLKEQPNAGETFKQPTEQGEQDD